MRRAHASVAGCGELKELADALRRAQRLRIVGSGSRSEFLPSWDGEVVSTRSLSGVIQHDVEDQVVEVWAGTPVEELHDALAANGQCLPLVRDLQPVVSQHGGTVGGLISMNLPHAYSSQYGGPRDWVLGMTIVRTDGTTAKCGSKAVKNVAGYDAHRLFVGSRGTLVLIAKVILRTFPIKALVAHQVELKSDAALKYVSRCLRAEFSFVVERTSGLIAIDPASCTLWSSEPPPESPAVWTIGVGGFIRRQQQPDKFEESAKRVFDPTGKLAPGWN